MSYTLGRFLKAEWRIGPSGSYSQLETVRDSELSYHRVLTYTPQNGQEPAAFEVDGISITGRLLLANDSEINELLDATPCGLSPLDNPDNFIWLRITQALYGDSKDLRSTYSPVSFGGSIFVVRTIGRRDPAGGRPEDGQPAWIDLPFRIMMDPCDAVGLHIDRDFV